MRMIKSLSQCKAVVLILVTVSFSGGAMAADSTFKPVSSGSSIMTSSTSVASGMSMSSKYMPSDAISFEGAHPIVSLRKNQSDVVFDLGLGSVTGKVTATGSEASVDKSVMHVGLGTTIVMSTGLRFGAHAEIGDDPITTKETKPLHTSVKTKYTTQDISIFAAAGLTRNIGLSLNLIMADREVSIVHETATLFSPAVMIMLDETEVIFDLIQSNEDVLVDGHWRMAVIHKLDGDTFATGHIMRVQPFSGTDHWNFAIGGRKKSSGLGSMGAEFLVNQRVDTDNGACYLPTLMGVQGDLDHELSSKQVISVGAAYKFGSCSHDGLQKRINSFEAKGSFLLMF
jgi:hypothetical protein